METEYMVSRYDGAIMLLPPGIRMRARALVHWERAAAEEIRLRVGYAPSVVMPDGERSLGGEKVTSSELASLMEIVTGASAHSSGASVRAGYVTAKGGYRVGFCGTVSMRDGEVVGFRDISSASVRISREMRGVSKAVIENLFPSGDFASTLILSPPGGGKTTLLRDIVRCISNGSRHHNALRVGLADERGEIAALKNGVPQMDVGMQTDVLEGCGKDKAMMMLLRGMNPQVIAADEITAERDIDAIESAVGCGVKILATAHADDIRALGKRKLYRRLAEQGIFEKVVEIKGTGSDRRYIVSDAQSCM